MLETAVPQPRLRPSAGSGTAADSGSEEALVEAHAHYAAGVVYDLNDEPERALHEYSEAARADPGNEPLILEVSRRLLQTKQPEEALKLLELAAAQPKASGAIFARLGFIYSQLGRHDLAVKANSTAIKKQPRAIGGYQNLFLNYFQNKQLKEALEVLDQAAKVPNTRAEFLIVLADLYATLGMQVPAAKTSAFAKAQTVLERAEKLNPADPQLRLRLADEFGILGKDDQAAANYLESLKQLPDVPLLRDGVRAKLADIYRRQRDWRRAAEQLQAIIHDDPTDAEAYYLLGEIAYEQKKFAEAADNYSKTILLSPDTPAAYYDLAQAQLSQNQGGEALATLDKARQKFQPTFALEYYSGIACSQQKEYAEASKHFTAAEVMAQATTPKLLDDFFYYELANAQLSQDKNRDAIATLDKAREKFPQSLALQYLTGIAYSRQKEYAEAIKHFTAAEAIAQTNDPAQLTNLYFQIGAACERKGDYPQAEKAFEKCLQLAPNFSEALNYLGYMWADHGEKLDRAHELIEKALKLEPKNVAYLDSMGWVLFKLNQPKEALGYILQAIKFSEEEDAEVYSHLGDIYAALGQTDKAHEAWRKSLAIELSDQVQKKLEPGAAK